MHKGYTLNYFIDFFKNIPSHRWTKNKLEEPGTVRKCALGHCLTDNRSGYLAADGYLNMRGRALQEFLYNSAEKINDGKGKFKRLGATPRGRILRALRNRKRTGNIFGNQ